MLHRELPSDSAIFLGIYPGELKMCVHTKLYTLFIAVLFIIAKKWEQPECPTTNEWVNYTYAHTLECDSVIGRNKALLPAVAWMKLENIIISERRQSQKTTYYVVPFM